MRTAPTLTQVLALLILACDGAMDDFFVARCSTAPGCHDGAGATVWTDLKTPQGWKRLLDARATFSGRNDLINNTTKWDDSLLWRTTRSPVVCPGGQNRIMVSRVSV